MNTTKSEEKMTKEQTQQCSTPIHYFSEITSNLRMRHLKGYIIRHGIMMRELNLNGIHL